MCVSAFCIRRLLNTPHSPSTSLSFRLSWSSRLSVCGCQLVSGLLRPAKHPVHSHSLSLFRHLLRSCNTIAPREIISGSTASPCYYVTRQFVALHRRGVNGNNTKVQDDSGLISVRLFVMLEKVKHTVSKHINFSDL